MVEYWLTRVRPNTLEQILPYGLDVTEVKF